MMDPISHNYTWTALATNYEFLLEAKTSNINRHECGDYTHFLTEAKQNKSKTFAVDIWRKMRHKNAFPDSLCVE